MEPKPSLLRNMLLAFLVGGTICLIGQFVFDFFKGVEQTEAEASAITLAAMIFLGAVATGLGVYDELGELGGAGAAVPITGFSNSIVSAAMEFKREGLILGMGCKMFIIAGPVLVYGILSGFLVGLVKGTLLGYFR
ncbi:MAG: stage V sporulation protein AC [Firmicutes bacterium]|nr:stage V sporulation protein AC [Bacillota bacterium]